MKAHTPTPHPNPIHRAARPDRQSTFALPAGLTRKLIGSLVLAAGFATSAPAQDLTPAITVRGDGKTVATFSTVGAGTWTIPAGVSEVEVLVVGGGGGGGRKGGGGGGGGFFYTPSYVPSLGTVTVAIGAGGLGDNGNNTRTAGSQSVFDTVIAYGGGIGNPAGTTNGGASGGNNQGDPGIAGTPTNGAGGSGAGPGSGAGGAGGFWANLTGGIGKQSAITGVNSYYGGGGGGWFDGGNNDGGLGGGGEGSIGGGAGVSGVNGLGGGGGDARDSGSGGNGGSGVVMIAYVDASVVTYTVSYDSNGGSTVASEVVPQNLTATEPSAPTLAGFSFGGWFSDQTLTLSYDFNAPVTQNITLYAAWITNYTVSFASNGGSAVASQEVPENGTATEPSVPTRTGYTFTGWYLHETLSTLYDFQDPVTADVMLDASWIINSYTLIYTPGINGTLTGDSPQTVEHGASGTAVTAIPDAGFLFLKWSDESLSNPRTDSNVTGNITVTALFAAIPPPFLPDTLVTRGDGKTVATFSTVGNGTWTIPDGVTSLEVLVVGGGGGGGNVTGGGGAGGLYSTEAYAVTPGNGVIINVGDGGNGGATGTTGQNSSFDTFIAYGGMAGAATGGSSGGNNQGGTVYPGGTNQGGGGGAGQAGQNNWFAAPNNNGGNGLQDDITGSLTYYGGGGSTYYNGSQGGLGGGGSTLDDNNGGIANPNGVDGLGGGGASGRNINGASGGSGVVIVAYMAPTGTVTTIELDSTLNPSIEGQEVTFTATIKDGGVTATTASGTVEFKVDDVVLAAAATITDGVATYTTSALAVGGRAVVATYSGDGTFAGSSGNLTQTVNASPYNQWAGSSGYNLTGGTDDDDDGDGLSNFQEFAFGLNPTSGASVNPITDISTLNSNGTFSYTRLAASSLTYTVWTSTSLLPNEWTLVPGADQEADPAVNGVETVLVTLPEIPTASKFFVRVKAN